jgi:hypothetical protein
MAVMPSHFNSARSLTSESNIAYPPVGICTHCRDYTRNTEEINQKCASYNTGFSLHVVEKGLATMRRLPGRAIFGAGKMESRYLCRGSGWTATLAFEGNEIFRILGTAGTKTSSRL